MWCMAAPLVHTIGHSYRVSGVDPPGHRSSSSAAWRWKARAPWFQRAATRGAWRQGSAPSFCSVLCVSLGCIAAPQIWNVFAWFCWLAPIMLTSQFCLDFLRSHRGGSALQLLRASVLREKEPVCLEMDCIVCVVRVVWWEPTCHRHQAAWPACLGKMTFCFLNDQKLSSDPATPDGTVPGCVVRVLRRAGCLKVGEAWRRISAYLLFGAKILIYISLCFAAICENLLFASKIKYNFKRIYKQLRNHAQPLSVCLSISQRPFLKNAFCDIIFSI